MYRNSRNLEMKHRANYRAELAPTILGYTPDPADKRTICARPISDLHEGEMLGFRTMYDVSLENEFQSTQIIENFQPSKPSKPSKQAKQAERMKWIRDWAVFFGAVSPAILLVIAFWRA